MIYVCCMCMCMCSIFFFKCKLGIIVVTIIYIYVYKLNLNSASLQQKAKIFSNNDAFMERGKTTTSKIKLLLKSQSIHVAPHCFGGGDVIVVGFCGSC